MNVREYVETQLQPRLQADGGWVEVIGCDGDRLRLRFRGECAKCMILDRCVDWIRDMLLRDLGAVPVIEYERKKAYFLG